MVTVKGFFVRWIVDDAAWSQRELWFEDLLTAIGEYQSILRGIWRKQIHSATLSAVLENEAGYKNEVILDREGGEA